MDYLTVDHVTKHFPLLNGSGSSPNGKTFCVLKNVSLRVTKGEFITTIGHSGCGKSTLLNIIAGFDKGWKVESSWRAKRSTSRAWTGWWYFRVSR
ncbi:MAG TPA: ATP-binding cassette domain-containing protein [Candidatus Binatia bacterium]